MLHRTFTVHRPKDLPHWSDRDGIYFVTFRLADSLPFDRPAIVSEIERRLEADASREFLDHDRQLDRGIGSCVLRDPAACAVMADALKRFDGDRYSLFAWTVMPNHVHVVARIFGSEPSRVIHSWKSYTANQINRRIGKSGALWQRDYFDYIVRDVNELRRVCEYVRENPQSARVDAPSWSREIPSHILALTEV